MMLSYLTFFAVNGVLLLGFLVAADDLQLYPPAQPGYERMVIRLPPMSDERPRKVEIIVGQLLKTDCNKHWFVGALTKKTVHGWGYPYYEVVSENQAYNPRRTAKLCEDQQVRDTFVQMYGEGFLLGYAVGATPIVVYVPTGFEVHYRMWAATPEIGKAHAE